VSIIKISADLERLRPYLRKVSHLIPLERLKHVISYLVPPNRISRVQARCYRSNNNKVFTITLQRARQHYKHARKSGTFRFAGYSKYSKMELLSNLAHELAHVVYWPHTVEHALLANRIERALLMEYRRRGRV